EKAVEDFNRFLKKEPKEANAYLNRGMSYLFLGDTTRAMNDYNKAIQLNAHDPEGYVRRSRIYSLRQQYDEAISDLDQAISIDTANTYAYFNRALLKYETKNLKSALEDLNKVLDDDPGNALTLYNRALIYTQVGEFADALDDYDRVININPENVLAYFNRASVFMELGRYREAIDDYSRAINLYPDFAKAYMNRSYAKNMLGQYNSSKSDYKIAQQKIAEYKAKTSTEEGYGAFADTTRQYDHLLALDAEFAKKNFDNELLQYRDVDIRLKPLYKFVPAYAEDQEKGEDLAMLGRKFIYERIDQFYDAVPVGVKFASVKDAEAYFSAKSVARINGDLATDRSAANLFAKAMVETSVHQYNTAMVCYDEAIKKDPENEFLYINRGALQAEMIDFISSMDNNVQVLTMDNTNTARTRLQDRSTRSYDYTAAIHDMTRAAQVAPEFPYVYYNLGNLYCLSNDLPESISQYTRALEIYPYIPEAYYNRGLVLIYLKDKEKGCMDISKAGELGISDAYSVIKKYCSEEK
ncbi:MAG: tetratricopeptide repeat protein, partial [Bacteroidales bacterium]|nr:tetratricopeptide repeat protein [Bacteroidales bacterium]